MRTRRDFLATRGAGAAASALGVKVVYHNHVGNLGTFAALADVGYRGWLSLELDAVPDRGGSPSASMLTSKRYIEPL